MEELLRELNKKYNLSLGYKTFSPIMKLSIGLALNYQEKVKSGFEFPFHLSFPDKQNSALWLSIALMNNYLREDFIKQPQNRVQEFNINNGDKIEIYGAIAQVDSVHGSEIVINFTDQKGFIINKSQFKYINIVDRGRSVNSFNIYKRNKKREGRNSISKLLGEQGFVNPKILQSKILVVAGRGNTGSFTNRLKQESIYNTQLSEIFNCGENLIIKPDLEDFQFIDQKESREIEKRFEYYFLKFINELYGELPGKKEAIASLIFKVKNGDYRNRKFKHVFEEIVSKCSRNSKYHDIKEKYYRGIKEELPRHLKAVVLNDIVQLEVYHGVIEEFLKRRIPVIIISNKYIEEKRILVFTENYFKTHREGLRINWDRKKIQALSKISFKQNNALDLNLWEKCLRFSKQRIIVKTTDPHPVDGLLIKLQRAVSNLEGYERLKNAYWRYFNPLVYSFKNNIGWASYHNELLARFLSVFEEIKVTLDRDLMIMFNEIIHELKTNNQSLKFFNNESIVFAQQIDLEKKTVIFPDGNFKKITPEKVDNSISSITFPGFPLNEPINNFLIDVISEYFVKDIEIFCWPNEGELTYNYILKRLRAGYFSDNIPNHWIFPNKLLIQDREDIEKELQETLSFDLKNQNGIEENNIESDEESLRKISTFKYNAYQSGNTFDSNSKVTCDIIDLERNQFIFLPKGSTVLAKVETEGENFDIKKAKFADLKVGDEIFQYELSRHQLRKLSKNADYQENIFTELEKWKNSLTKSFEEDGRNLHKLLKRLEKVNLEKNLDANPSYQNLRNWLYDEDMLSPEKQNLQMILYADSDTELINEFSNIYDAYRKARSLSKIVSSKIRKLIINKLKSLNLSEKSRFGIRVFGSPMEVKFRKIRGLQKADIEVEYQNTRKIIE